MQAHVPVAEGGDQVGRLKLAHVPVDQVVKGILEGLLEQRVAAELRLRL
jgi:hypothetical protein